MNYEYIEQLLERYWECQTTLEEEAILRTFFAQADIPARLLPYRDLFQTEEKIAKERLSDDFDQRLMDILKKEEQEAKCHRTSQPPMGIVRPFTLSYRLRPFYRAAAVVAVILTIGMAAQQGFQQNETPSETTSQLSTAQSEDTIRLFTDMPELSEQTEAALTTTQDTLTTTP